MVRIDDTVFCDGCGAEITWGPIFDKNRRYCCLDCSHGLKCDCGVRMEVLEESSDSHSSFYEVSSKSTF